MRRLSRREWLKAAPVAALPLLTGRVRSDDPPFPGLTVRMHEPRNLEFPFSSLKSWITPNEQFYVRSHFAVPKVDPKTWKLTVEGEVENKVELTLEELRALPAVTRPLTLECAGNNRVFRGAGGPRRPVGAGGGRQRRVDRGAARGDPGEGQGEGRGGRCDPGRGGQRHRRGVPGGDPLRPQPAAGEGPQAGGPPRLQDERRGPAGRPRGAGAGGGRRLVRDGVGEVADQADRHREATRRVLADDRLLVLPAGGRAAGPRPGDDDAAEGDHRPARTARGGPGRQAVQGASAPPGPGRRSWPRSRSAPTAARPGTPRR